jgi:dethiobiotin synthetase
MCGVRPVTVAVGVTGTDTGVGKTVVACTLARALVSRGMTVGVLKPVETGVAAGTDPEDATQLRAAAGQVDAIDVVCPYVFPDAVAPIVASARAGVPIELPRLDRAFDRAAGGRDAVVVEGAGGWLVPYLEGVTFETLCMRWHLDIVIVAANRLGVLNHAMLTVRAAETTGLRVTGVVLNNVSSDPSGLAESTNAVVLRELLPGRRVVSFPYVPNPGHIPSLVEAARSCDLLSVIRNPVS